MTVDFDLIRLLFRRRTTLNILIPFIKISLEKEISLTTVSHNEDEVCNHLVQLQISLLNQTVLDPLQCKYPMSIGYTRQFVKKLIQLFEKLFLNSSLDCFYYDIYTVYARLIDEPGDIRVDWYLFANSDSELLDNLYDLLHHNENDGFVTHQINSMTVSILETNQIVSSGTTGFRTWPAAIHLLDYLLEMRDGLIGQELHWNRNGKWSRIIELGAGSGLLGIGLIKAGFVRDGQYTFTDHNEKVLNRIKLNLFANEVEQVKSNIFIQLLDWFDHTSLDTHSNKDLIVASDVIFDPKLVTELVKTLAYMMKTYAKNDSLHRWPDCLICCAQRNPESLNYFADCLKANGLEAQEVHRQNEFKWVKSFRNRIANYNVTDLQTLTHLNADNIASVVYRVVAIQK